MTRAITRAAVVLLCSHFERYLRSVSEEAVSEINQQTIDPNRLELALRLQHSRRILEESAARQWDQREASLRELIRSEGWLWHQGGSQPLDASALLAWMKTPKPKQVIRLYKLWGIDDIFSRITRREHTRRRFFLQIMALVEKRNNIAHGDFTVEATVGDVRNYRVSVSAFCDRADRALAHQLTRQLGVPLTW